MRRFRLLLTTVMLGLVSAFVASCQSDDTISVASIEISNPENLQLKVGQTDILKVAVLPEDAENPKFAVTVADTSIVTVSEDYVITALAEGETTITVTTEDGGKTASINVKVLPADIRQVTVAEFLEAEVHPHIWYELTGVITEIVDEEHGNLYLQDGEDTVYVYGVTAEKTETNDKSFASLGLKVKDTLTIIGTRDYYADAQDENQKDRVGGPAYYKSHVEFVTDLTFDFAVTDQPDADGFYYATVTPSDAEREYVVMDVNEYALHAFVEEGDTTEAWMAAYITNTIEALNEEAGGILTKDECVALFLAERGKTGVCEGFALEPSLGDNYVMAFTINNENDITDLQYQMYLEIVPDNEVQVGMALVSAKAKDLVISLDFPNNWLKDPYYPTDNHPVLICWGKKQDIGSFTDEELVARDYNVLKGKAAEAAEEEIVVLKQSYQIYWRDQPDSDPLFLSDASSLYAEDGFESETDYVIYAYAMQYDYTNGNFFAASKIARLEATTSSLNLVNTDFVFGIDRIQPAANGDLMAYFSVSADDVYQRFTFCAVNETELASYASGGKTATIENLATDILQSHIDEHHSSYYTQPLENWTYLGAGFSKNGTKINATDNKWYIVAGALDGDLAIASEVQYELFDLTGKTSTEVAMNLTVTGAEGSYTYSVNPDTTPYILTTITVKEMEKWIADNNSFSEDVPGYVNDFITGALKNQTAAEYLKANGKTAAVSNEAITVTEDTYVIAYTLYEKSGAVNGLEYELLKAPASTATVVILTEEEVTLEDGGSWAPYQFDLKWKDGRICFMNEDGEWDNNTYKYTHTPYIILDKVYSTDDDVYTIDLGFTYKGNPDYYADSKNIFATDVTIITTSNGDGTYTITAEVFYEDDTHFQYIYNGAIPEDLLN